MGGLCGLSPGMQGLCVQSAAPVSVQGELRPRLYQAKGVACRHGQRVWAQSHHPPRAPSAHLRGLLLWPLWTVAVHGRPSPARALGPQGLPLAPLQEVTELGFPAPRATAQALCSWQEMWGQSPEQLCAAPRPTVQHGLVFLTWSQPVPRRSGPCHLGVSGHFTPLSLLNVSPVWKIPTASSQAWNPEGLPLTECFPLPGGCGCGAGPGLRSPDCQGLGPGGNTCRPTALSSGGMSQP